MKIHRCQQGSEQWEMIRKGKATASRFGEILTPSKLDLSKSSVKYAAELVAQRLGIESTSAPPTYWMQYGIEAEEYAFREFVESTGFDVQRVGFVELNEWCGCSPDGLVGDDATLEIKCPKAETLIQYTLNSGVPFEYLLQVQGSLWVTGRQRCHFFAWHPAMQPLHVIAERDEAVMAAMDRTIPAFIESVKMMTSMIKTRPVPTWCQFINDMGDDLE